MRLLRNFYLPINLTSIGVGWGKGHGRAIFSPWILNLINWYFVFTDNFDSKNITLKDLKLSGRRINNEGFFARGSLCQLNTPLKTFFSSIPLFKIMRIWYILHASCEKKRINCLKLSSGKNSVEASFWILNIS